MTDCDHLTMHICNYNRHMVVHLTGLYTRLVTYGRLHILTLVGSFYHDSSYTSFIVLFLILIISLSFISVYYVVIAYIIFMHEQLFFTHTLIRSLLTTLDSHVQDFGHLSYIVQVFVETVSFARSWSFSLLIPIFLLFLPFCYFLILGISDSIVISVLYL